MRTHTIAFAITYLGVSRRTVYNMLADGRLLSVTHFLNQGQRVTAESLEQQKRVLDRQRRDRV